MDEKFIGSVVVIIPCYEPSEKDFLPYVWRLTDAGVKEIVIVNDGSGEKYANVFSSLKSNEKVTVLSYEKNQGKGFALKTAFKYCKDAFDDKTVFVTADCDGQHTVEDVFNVALEAWNKRDSFVLGSRDFSGENVPKRSRNGNVFTRGAFSALYGIKLNDTQTGLRAFGYSFFDELLKIKGRRFEYEMNQLIVLSKSGHSLIEVPITTVYKPKSEDVEKVSHYDTLKDSIRVGACLFGNISWYFLSGVVSALIDMLAFYIFDNYVFIGFDSLWRTLLPVASARVISSIFNAAFNFSVVFKGKSASCFVRYYMLWTLQLAASYGITELWSIVIPSGIWLTLLKGICDLALSFISFAVQREWVFKDRRTKTKFYGPFARFGRILMNIFMSPRYASNVSVPETGVVYVCRHLNMKGPLVLTKNLGFDTHMLVFNAFFSFKTAYKHYSTITYVKNGKPCLKGKIKAFFAAIFVPKIMKSTIAIPVHRGNSRSITTLKNMTKYLLEGESVCVFPDIDYKANEGTESDIYGGFLIAEKMYFKRTGRHVAFIPLYLDENNNVICEREAIYFADGDFASQQPIVAEKIKNAIQTETYAA